MHENIISGLVESLDFKNNIKNPVKNKSPVIEGFECSVIHRFYVSVDVCVHMCVRIFFFQCKVQQTISQGFFLLKKYKYV